MSNAIVPFEFEGRENRILMIDDEYWFVAKDVAEALGYAWKGVATIGHVPEEWRGVYSVQTPSGDQEMLTLSEQGLYFFLGRSDKPGALSYQKKVAGEVMPSIRKTGSYSVRPMTEVDKLAILIGRYVPAIEARQSAIEERVALVEQKAEAVTDNLEQTVETKVNEGMVAWEERETLTQALNFRTSHAVSELVDRLVGPRPNDPGRLVTWKQKRTVEFHQINKIAKAAAGGRPRNQIRDPRHAKAALEAVYQQMRGFGMQTPSIPEPADFLARRAARIGQP